jgi:hypothetical protein
MNPAPPEIWRFALSALHVGQVLRGAALMGCSASHAWPQAVHTYSYVIGDLGDLEACVAKSSLSTSFFLNALAVVS